MAAGGGLARCIDDPRCPGQVVHSLADMIGLRIKMIAAGYEDGNDANRQRSDPIFKMAQDAPLRVGIWRRNRQCAGWRTCPACGDWSRWAGRWSIFTAPPSGRFRSGSCLTLTTPLMPCMAASSFVCSMPITTSTASSRSWCSMAMAASSRRGGRVGQKSASPAPPSAGDPEQLAEHPDPDPGRQPLLQPTGHRLVPRQRC